MTQMPRHGARLSGSVARFNDFIANDYRARLAAGEKSIRYDNVRLFALFCRAFRRLRLTYGTYEEYRADLRRAGYLTLQSGTYSYSVVPVPKIPSRRDLIRGQNCDLSNFSHKSASRPLKTKSLPAQPGGPRPRNAQGRFTKSAPDDALSQGLPSQEAGFSDVVPITRGYKQQERSTKHLPDAHASQDLQNIDISDPVMRDAYRLLGGSIPNDALSQDLGVRRPLDTATVSPTDDDQGRRQRENLPNAAALEKPEKAKAQPGKKADEDFDFAAALERLKQPVKQQEYISRPIVERVPEPPRTKPKKEIDPNAPVATSFHNDNQQVTHEFYNYTMRNVPYLRNVRWEIIRPRKYPIKIWRMALAGLLSKWPGQIDTDNERYLVNLAGLLMRGQRRDPRRERGYRIVRECAVSEEFAGVTAFRVSQDEAKSIE